MDKKLSFSGLAAAAPAALAGAAPAPVDLEFTSMMSPAEQLKVEDDNNNACIKYVRENLGL